MSILHLNLDGDGAWNDLDRDKVIHVTEADLDLAVLPGGMESGAESVAFRIPLPDGREVIAETSWRALGTAARVIATRYGWPD